MVSFLIGEDCPSVNWGFSSGRSLLGALLVKSSAVALFWLNLPLTLPTDQGMPRHALLSLLFQAHPTANKASCCFTAALDTKPEVFMPFIVSFTSFGH